MTIPQYIVQFANACAKRNHHLWQEYYASSHMAMHHHVLTIVLTCANHAH